MADTMERRTAADTALRLRGVHHLALNTDDMAKTVDFYVRGRLSHQRLDPVLDIARVATVGETHGEPTHQPQSAIHLSQEKRTRVRRDVAAIKTGHRVRLNRSKLEQLRDT